MTKIDLQKRKIEQKVIKKVVSEAHSELSRFNWYYPTVKFSNFLIVHARIGDFNASYFSRRALAVKLWIIIGYTVLEPFLFKCLLLMSTHMVRNNFLGSRACNPRRFIGPRTMIYCTHFLPTTMNELLWAIVFFCP